MEKFFSIVVVFAAIFFFASNVAEFCIQILKEATLCFGLNLWLC